ncbi:MAG TPA: NYN domain-containing protein [Anaerolineales bacterium]|nr:NYN domain-containing protein [Anaerolineales bacterium]
MERVIAYIDGYNLYYGLKEQGWKRFYWLNLQKLSEQFLRSNQTLITTKYFTTIVKQPNDKRLRQQVFLEALKTLSNLPIFYGHFLSDQIACRRCGHTYTTHHEKMTDVNISVELMRDAFQDQFDVAFLISADSDLIAPIRTVQQLFPKKKIVSIFPPGRFSSALKHVSNGTLRIGHVELSKSLFPDQINKAGIILQRPNTWR